MWLGPILEPHHRCLPLSHLQERYGIRNDGGNVVCTSNRTVKTIRTLRQLFQMLAFYLIMVRTTPTTTRTSIATFKAATSGNTLRPRHPNHHPFGKQQLQPHLNHHLPHLQHHHSNYQCHYFTVHSLVIHNCAIASTTTTTTMKLPHSQHVHIISTTFAQHKLPEWMDTVSPM